MKSKAGFKNFVMLLAVFAAAIFFRVLLTKYAYINNIIGCINTISCIFVCCLIFEVAEKRFTILLNNSSNILGNKIKKHKQKYFNKIYKQCIITLLILSILYFIFWANSIVNDIISFISLFLSIETDYIGICIGGVYF